MGKGLLLGPQPRVLGARRAVFEEVRVVVGAHRDPPQPVRVAAPPGLDVGEREAEAVT